MKKYIELDANDIKQILAEKFGTGIENVVLDNRKQLVGYGPAEHEAVVLTARICITEDKENKKC